MKKEMVVFCYYVNVYGLSREMVINTMNEIIKMNENTFDDVTDKIVKQFYLPIKEGETRMECIYPINTTKEYLVELLSSINKEDLKSLKDTIDEIEKGE